MEELSEWHQIRQGQDVAYEKSLEADPTKVSGLFMGVGNLCARCST